LNNFSIENYKIKTKYLGKLGQDVGVARKPLMSGIS
jgi:hypothetical protein